nr:hypothetical transcript [Hymenolepis microstoma]
MKGRQFLVMEYGERGSLKDFLQKYSQPVADDPESPNIPQLTKFAQQIAKGMAYLASKRVVNSGLASRNVVLSELLVAKVIDFGLTRKAEFYYPMRNSSHVPLKWMAPGSVCEKLFTTKSDVWSLGVLRGELLSLGEMPAFNITNDEFLRALRNGMVCKTEFDKANEDS